MQNLGLNQSDKQFELMNRPFVEFKYPILQIVGKDLNSENLPTLIFYTQVNLLNHGKLPANVKSIEAYIIDGTQEKLRPFMPYIEDKEKQWKNFDLFPKSPITNEKGPFINISDHSCPIWTA